MYAVFESIFHPRLFREDLLRGLAMVAIIISYVGIILVNHIKAAGMPELEKISDLALFFYSPLSSRANARETRLTLHQLLFLAAAPLLDFDLSLACRGPGRM